MNSKRPNTVKAVYRVFVEFDEDYGFKYKLKKFPIPIRRWVKIYGLDFAITNCYIFNEKNKLIPHRNYMITEPVSGRGIGKTYDNLKSMKAAEEFLKNIPKKKLLDAIKKL